MSYQDAPVCQTCIWLDNCWFSPDEPCPTRDPEKWKKLQEA